MNGLYRAVLLIGACLILFPLCYQAQNQVPRFEKTDCTSFTNRLPVGGKAECGFLVVAQDRKKPVGKTFRLAVVILRPATPPTEPPLVFLHGGPSGPGGIRGGEMSNAVAWSTKLNRDLIVFDQRGAGLSEPKLCIDNVRTPQAAEKILNTRDQKELQEFFNESSRKCIASLKAQNVDADTFGSEFNAADLVDLRKTLGYQKWDLIGVSYGGRFVQEAMRRDPKGIRSVVMHSPSFVGGGVEYEGPRTYQRVLEHIFTSCAAQAPCASAFPMVEKDFYDVYDELNKNPFDVVIERGNDKLNVRFDGERFVASLRNNFTQKVSRIPVIINELKRGDRMKAAQYLVADSNAGGGFNNTLTDLVGCYDGYGPDYLKREAAILKEVREPFRRFANDLQECVIWHSRFAPRSDHDLVQSDIPALVFTAEFDHLNPFDFGKQIAGALKTAYHFELPGQTHGQRMTGCPESIVFQFLKDPMQKPDASCLASMPKVAFELKRFDRPNLMFTISNVDGKKTPFEGNWEAVFPNAPVVLTIDLKINGDLVSGSIMGPAGPIVIYDGKVGSDTMSFKVKTPEGGRIITVTGKLTGDEISFTRDVEVLPGGTPGGAFIFGVVGARNFVARRAQ